MSAPYQDAGKAEAMDKPIQNGWEIRGPYIGADKYALCEYVEGVRYGRGLFPNLEALDRRFIEILNERKVAGHENS